MTWRGRLAGLGGARLLPFTMAALAVLLAAKSVILVQASAAATAALAPAAQAAPAPAPDAKMTAVSMPPVPSPPASGRTPDDVSPAERDVLLDLRQRRTDLDDRARRVASQEATLAAAERKLGDRIGELRALQAKLEALESARHERDEANWAGLVKVYETMRPRDAAAIMNDLDMAVVLHVMDRMKDRNAAALLAAMKPERARLVTAQLADLRTRENAPATPTAQP